MIAVTGASGHLGQWVVARLTERGHEVLCISRRPVDQPTIAGVRWARAVRTLPCDLSDAASVRACAGELRRAEAVVHLAANVPADTAANLPQDADATLRYNVVGTACLLAALKGGALRSLVYASTFEVYGAPEHQPVDEAHPTRPLGYYGASKLAGEKYVQLFAADSGVPCASLRMPAIYGPGDTLKRAIGNFIRALAAGGELTIHGDGEDLRELLYAADGAEAVALCIDKGASGPMNLASGRGYSIREMAEAAMRAAGGSGKLVQRERVKPRFDYVMSIGLARERLGWVPATTLDAGVKAQLGWLRGG